MVFKWIYDIKNKKLYKTKEEKITKNLYKDDFVEFTYNQKKIKAFYYALGENDKIRICNKEKLILINDFTFFVIEKLIKRNRFYNGFETI